MHPREVGRNMIQQYYTLLWLVSLLLLCVRARTEGCSSSAITVSTVSRVPALYVVRPWPSTEHPWVRVQVLRTGCVPRARSVCSADNTVTDAAMVHRPHAEALRQFEARWHACRGAAQEGEVQRTHSVTVYCDGDATSAVAVALSTPRVRPECGQWRVISHVADPDEPCGPAVVRVQRTHTECANCSAHWMSLANGTVLSARDGAASEWHWIPASASEWTRVVGRSSPRATMVLTLVPSAGACEPQALRVEPYTRCTDPPRFGLDWSVHMPVWMTLAWALLYLAYLSGIQYGTWHRFPRVGAVATAAILAVHVPFAAYTPFVWYATGTALALGLPLLALAVRGAGMLCAGPSKFRLPDRDAAEHVGQFLVFAVLQTAVLACAIALQR